MAETISLTSLYLMLAAPALLLVWWALRGEALARPLTTFASMAAIAALTALFWLLARWWAGELRPVLSTLAAVLGFLLLLPLAFGAFPGHAPDPLNPASYIRRARTLYSLLISLVIYGVMCLVVAARFAITGRIPLENRFLGFALLLAPALLTITLSAPRPLQHDAFLLLCLEWLYAAGCCGLIVTWASSTAGAAIVGSFGWIALGCAVAGLLWAFLAGKIRIDGRPASAVAAGALVTAGRSGGAWLVRLPGATARRLRELAEIIVFVGRALGRALVHLPTALARALSRLVSGLCGLLVTVAGFLRRGLALGWSVLLAATGRGLLALPGFTWRLLVRLASGLAMLVTAWWQGMLALPLEAGFILNWFARALWRSLAAIGRRSCILARFLSAAVLASGIWCWRHSLALVGWLAQVARVSALVYARAAVGFVRRSVRAARAFRQWLAAIPLALATLLAATWRLILTLPRRVGRAGRGLGHAVWRALLAVGGLSQSALRVLVTAVVAFGAWWGRAMRASTHWLAYAVPAAAAELVRVTGALARWVARAVTAFVRWLAAAAQALAGWIGTIAATAWRNLVRLASRLVTGTGQLAKAMGRAVSGLVLLVGRAARGLPALVAAGAAATARGLLILLAFAGRAGLALLTAGAAVGRAILALPGTLWRALRGLANWAAKLGCALALIASRFLRWVARLPLLIARMLLVLGKGLVALGDWLLALPGWLWNATVALVALIARVLEWLVRSTAALFRWLWHAVRREVPVLGRSFKAHPWLSAVVIAPSIAVVAWMMLRPPPPLPQLRMVAGSGFSSFEPILKRWGQENNFDVQVSYKGSLDIMLMLESGNVKADAIWEGDSMWTSLGDKHHLIKNSKSIMCSPIVFGIKKSLAQEFAWIGRDVRMQELLDAAEKRRLRVLMTSATQSNSGASAYFGFLYAFAGQPEILTAEHLKDPVVGDKVRRTLASINRTSESSGWMRDLFLERYDRYDGMFNYESHILEMNQQLVARGDEPLYIIYPAEGLGMADFPFSFVRTAITDPAKEEAVQKLQDYLLSPSVQAEIAEKGRRVGPLCDEIDPAIFQPTWGADSRRIVNSLNYPSEPVIRQALDLYQTDFRKPSFTVYALDFSASMDGEGKQKLTEAMRTLLDQEAAAKYLLQASPNDETAVVVFDDELMNDPGVVGWTVAGNDEAALCELLGKIERQPLGHFTNIYLPVQRALELIQAARTENRFPAIILLTDGQSNRGSLEDVKKALAASRLDVPVYGIVFGEADVDQLNGLADLTTGRVFDGTKDLVSAFRKAKGNN